MGGPDAGKTCSPTPAEGSACNSLMPTGPLVPYECLAATIPTPAGGTIEDGTYVLTASAFYGTPCPAPEQDRDIWFVCGTTWQAVQELTAGTSPAVTYTYEATATPAGADSFTLNVTCPTATSVARQYTATPITLTLFVGDGTAAGTGRVDTYTRQ